MSGIFTGNLDVRCDSENAMWTLLAPLTYTTAEGSVIAVPVGFSTNLASIPQWFQAVLPVNDKHRRAAVIHDYLYGTHEVTSTSFVAMIGTGVTRLQADKILLEAMEACHEVRWRRQAIYLAVRLGGASHWSK